MPGEDKDKVVNSFLESPGGEMKWIIHNVVMVIHMIHMSVCFCQKEKEKEKNREVARQKHVGYHNVVHTIWRGTYERLFNYFRNKTTGRTAHTYVHK